ncbi:Divalent Anion:Na+ Symporter [Blattamonas nauphoetae]|uniref:Divalent Anion:Na+ Symporter n=1 Tax=Blattamonas nauphoetae TaxID=2049346 RepID=A0ABQ9Y4B4_9EUKA|nr:Divalent Anion:Na+ Symporter [Blattamonas nauphoetae]
MKFSRQLAFISIDRWKDYYVNYKFLKKQIKKMFRDYLKTDEKNQDTIAFSSQSVFSSSDIKPTKVMTLQQSAFPGLSRNPNIITDSPIPEEDNQNDPQSDSSQEMENMPPAAASEDAPPSPSPALSQQSSDAPYLRTSMSPESQTPLIQQRSSDTLPPLANPQSSLLLLCTQWSALYTQELQKVETFFRSAFTSVLSGMEELKDQITENDSQSGTIIRLKRIFLELCVDATELDHYCHVNKEGFRKIIKKFLKQVKPKGKHELDFIADQARHLTDQTQSLFSNLPSASEFVEQIEAFYVQTFSAGKFNKDYLTMPPEKKKDLELQLMHEIADSTEAQVAWKKNTILSGYIEHREKAHIRHTHPDSSAGTAVWPQEKDLEVTKSTAKPPVTKIQCKWIPFGIAVLVLIVMWAIPWNDDYVTQLRCLGLLAYACVLWATEAIPLFATAISLPVLSSLMGLMDMNDFRQGGKDLIKSTISNTPYVAIGGFSISFGLSATGLDENIMHWVLHFKVCRKPVVFVLIITLLETLITMVVSNVSSTVMVMSLSLSVLREVGQCNFSKLLLMNIAMAGNIAGMITPLASPQSLVGLEEIGHLVPNTKLNFGTWTLAALPLCAVIIALCFMISLCIYPIDIDTVPFTPAPKTKVTRTQVINKVYVAVVTVSSIVLWFVCPYLPALSNEAIVGMMPFILLFGFGIVHRSKIAELPWGMILLVMGGNALGASIQKSKLLELVSTLFKMTPLPDWPIFVQMLLMNLVVGVVSIFVSHTVAAIVLVPIVASIIGTDSPHLQMIMMACALMVSPPMILSVASFPNMCVFEVEDDMHQPFLTAKDFGIYGTVVTVLSYIAVNSVFFGIAYAMGL